MRNRELPIANHQFLLSLIWFVSCFANTLGFNDPVLMTTQEVQTEAPARQESGLKSPALKPILLLAGGALALTMAASIWIYIEGTGELRAQAKAQGLYLHTEGANSNGAVNATDPLPQIRPATVAAELRVPRLIKQMDDWALRVTLATAAGGAGLMLVTILAINWWRRAWLIWIARTTKQRQEGVREVERVNRELQKQIAERKRLEDEVRRVTSEIDQRVTDRTATLNKTYHQLEEELNERKQAEKALAQQAQELERSKDVLELHVQARTLELQKLQRRYEHILNSAGEGIYGLDLQGRTTFINPTAAKLTGWKVEELVGKTEHDVFTRNQSTGKTSLLKKNGQQVGDGAPGEALFHRKDGSTFNAEYVKTAIMEKDKVVGAVVIFKDITERKRTEDTLARKAAELARSNAELEQFAYVASHDLQEPLRKIQAFGDRLKTKCDAVQLKDGRDYLDRMQSAAARMQTLINDLLSYSRVISTTQPFVPVDLGVVTKEVLTDLEVRIEQTKAKVEVGALPTIDADPLQLRQLLQNLVGNALKFQPPNAHPLIKINARLIGSDLAALPPPKQASTDGNSDSRVQQTNDSTEFCELTIEDNGIGFDEKYSEKIFAVFQRLHGRTEYEGTGVGLAVCRRITDRHGGTINAKSKLGEGATFIVTLPVKHAAGPSVVSVLGVSPSTDNTQLTPEKLAA